MIRIDKIKGGICGEGAKGKVYFVSIDEFKKWLDAVKVQRQIRLIQVHHTFQPDYSSFKGNNHFDLLESIENYHVKVKGWKKIAQNLCHRFKLTPSTDTMVYHHWYDLKTHVRTNGTGTTKSCPGSAFFGGNTVADANNYFIPLVKQGMAGM